MSKTPADDQAKDYLNQIQDIIVNQYESGYRYSRTELKDILDSIVRVVDGYANHSAVRQSVERQAVLSLREKHSEPIVSATIHSDDYRLETTFQANRWLSEATDQEIKDLASIDWGGDSAADEIAYFMEPLDSDVERVLDYSRIATQVSGDPMGFEVHVDATEALAWLQAHKPELWTEMAGGQA
jgi:hypothetical protein